MNTDFRTPFKIRILSPKEWHWSSQLNMRKDVLLSSILSKKNELCLSCVRCESIEITTSGDPSLTLSSFISSRNKCNLTSIIDSSMSEVYYNKSWNKPSDPFICFYFNKVIDPIAVVHVAQSFVFHRTVCTNKSLQWVSKVIVITKIKVFAVEHNLKTLNVNFIFRSLFMSKTEELYFLNLEDFSVINLSNHWSLRNDNQIIVDLHFYHTINCLYWDFLTIK